MYVEVKTRSEDRVLRGCMEAVRIDEIAEILTDLDKHNSISAEVEHASRQLDAISQKQDLRLLWHRAGRGPFVSNTKEQIGSTLYGMRMVLAARPPLPLRPWHCAYAGHADFFRFREIDGVMVEVDGLISLFLNPFSPAVTPSQLVASRESLRPMMLCSTFSRRSSTGSFLRPVATHRGATTPHSWPTWRRNILTPLSFASFAASA